MEEDDKSRNESSSMSKTEEIGDKVPEESKVGKLLADRTTKRVIILVLAMMIGIILFNSSCQLIKSCVFCRCFDI